jgi:UDP-galactopyranose mutase
MTAQYDYDYLIVGCGFTGATLAERIASELDASVLVIDKRAHIGGNSYDERDDHGIVVGKYGPHFFHTASEKVWKYISRFTTFNNYVHHVDAFCDGRFYALPLSLDTVNAFFETRLTAEKLPSFLDQLSERIADPHNAEEAVVSKVGWELYEAFFQNYMKKLWGMDPRDLDASIARRLPIRLSSDTRYFTDPWQGIPTEGYTKIFERMLSHKNIHLSLNTDYRDLVNAVSHRFLVFTGPIDAYFDSLFGKLPYRSIDVRFETHACEYVQHRGVVNYPNDHDFTRCVEYKWLYGQRHEKTTVSRDFPCWNDEEPYYPIPAPANRALYLKYKELAERVPNTYFCGRLGSYAYYNMDECIAWALNLFENRIAVQARSSLLPKAVSVL